VTNFTCSHASVAPACDPKSSCKVARDWCAADNDFTCHVGTAASDDYNADPKDRSVYTCAPACATNGPLIAPVINDCAQDPVDLTGLENFAVLAGAAVTSAGNSLIYGDIGVAPGTAVVGFGDGAPGELVGDSSIYAADAVAQAGTDALFLAGGAFLDAEGRPTACAVLKSGNLGGERLSPGLYKSSAGMEITGTAGTDKGKLFLDAGFDSDAVFIFQMASTFGMAANTEIVLENGAKAKNIFWQVGSAGTFGAGAKFKGTMMARAAITAGDGVIVDGRFLAGSAVTMLAGKFTLPEV
jgi:hypothetical protein